MKAIIKTRTENHILMKYLQKEMIKYRPEIADDPVSVKLDLQVDSLDISCSIMKMVVDKIAAFRKNIKAGCFEIRLFAGSEYAKDKTARIVLFSDGRKMVAESNSSRWDNAFLNAFDKISRNINTL